MPKTPLRLAYLLEASDRIHLTPAFRAYLLESAKVCLDHNSHSTGVRFAVTGTYRRVFSLDWNPSTEEERATCEDLEVATEHAAYGLAFLLVIHFTDHHVIRRAAKGKGFDYWLGERGPNGFQNTARLEVSGILANPGRIRGRSRLKKDQTRRSDYVRMAAYVAVVEFSLPTARLERRR